MRQKIFCDYACEPNVAVLEEVGIRHGAARVDFLVVNGFFHGFELKSDVDNLRRLDNQARIYSSALDRMTIVVSFRHADEALRRIPDWWGVKLVEQGKRGGIHFYNARNAQYNPTIDKAAVVQFLWRCETMEILAEIGHKGGMRSKTRKAMYAKLVECAELDFIRAKVRYYLTLRKGLGSVGQRMSNGG